MGDFWNIIFSVIFGGVTIVMFARFFMNNKKILIKGRRFSGIRIAFVAIGMITMLAMFSSQNTTFDYVRSTITLLCVSGLMMARDGIGEEGVVVGGKFYPWKECRAWDAEKKEHSMDMFFTLESQNKNKPDQYKTKTVEFDEHDMDNVLKFMTLNHGRKKQRMKKR